MSETIKSRKVLTVNPNSLRFLQCFLTACNESNGKRSIITASVPERFKTLLVSDNWRNIVCKRTRGFTSVCFSATA